MAIRMNITKCTRMHPILLNDVDFATFLGNFLLIDVRYIDIISFFILFVVSLSIINCVFDCFWSDIAYNSIAIS